MAIQAIFANREHRGSGLAMLHLTQLCQGCGPIIQKVPKTISLNLRSQNGARLKPGYYLRLNLEFQMDNQGVSQLDLLITMHPLSRFP